MSVMLLGMLVDLSREDGQNAEEPKTMDRARKGDDRHGGDNSGRGGGEYLRRCNGDCVNVRRMLRVSTDVVDIDNIRSCGVSVIIRRLRHLFVSVGSD